MEIKTQIESINRMYNKNGNKKYLMQFFPFY